MILNRHIFGQLLILSIITLINLNAICQINNTQTKSNAYNTFTVSEYNDVSPFIFNHHNTIKELWLITKKNEIETITPLTDFFSLGNVNGESYNLNFQGDSIIFYSLYPNFNKQLLQNKLINITGKHEKSKQFSVSQIFITKDSIKYLFTKNDKINTSELGKPAIREGKINDHKATLERLLLSSIDSLNGIDSTIVFSAKILANGFIKDITLEFGEPSLLSETVRKIFFEEPKTNKLIGLKKESTIWKPAVIYTSGQQVISRIRIYAKLLPNGNVNLALTPKLIRFLSN